MNSLTAKNNDGVDPAPQEFLDLSKSTLLQIRNSVIDEMTRIGGGDE